MQKGFMESFAALDADLFCLQETKLQQGQLELELPGYHQYWNYAEKKGYSGTAVFSRREPLSVRYGIGEDRAVRFHNDAKGQALNYAEVSEAVSQVRSNAPLGRSWKEKIEEDFRSRRPRR